MRLLGTITAAAGASTNNTTTAVPFTMPEHPCSLIYMPAATGLNLTHKATAAATDLPLLTANWTIPWGGRETGKVALWNSTGAPIACKVYATDVPGFVLNLL